MEYSELKEQTWIYFDNKYHFVQELNGRIYSTRL